MSLFIKIVLGFILAIVITISALFLFFVRFMRKVAKECANEHSNPLSIHLHKDLVAEWLEDDQVSGLISDFEALGFSKGSPYTIEELSGVHLFSLHHDKYCGVITQFRDIATYIDIEHRDTSGNTIIVTTSPDLITSEPQPGKTQIRLHNASVRDAFDEIRGKCANIESVVTTDDMFREHVESDYKAEQVFRNRNGGMSLNEFRSIAEKSGEKYSEEHILESFIELKEQELNQWHEAGLQEYREENKISFEEFYADDEYFIVPHKTDPSAFIHYLSDCGLIREEHVEKIALSVAKEENILALFGKINGARSPKLRAEHCGEIAFPVQAEVYKIDL